MTNSNGLDHNKNDIALKIERLYVKEINCKIPALLQKLVVAIKFQ